jgi:predicted RNase H-like HicB family nuclease
MNLTLSAVFEEVPESEGGGYVAYTEELPDAISEGEMLDEARENLRDAVEVLASNPESVVAYIEKARAIKRKALLPSRQPEERVALLSEALELLARARSLRPKNASAIYNTACYKALLDYPRSEILADLKAAFDLNPNLKRQL